MNYWYGDYYEIIIQVFFTISYYGNNYVIARVIIVNIYVTKRGYYYNNYVITKVTVAIIML